MADPIRQLLSQTSYTANGTDTVWNFSFSGGYIDKSHVKAKYLDAARVEHQIAVTPGMFLGQYQLNITPPIAVGSELVIYRDTPKEGPLVDFADRAALTEQALDLNAKQAIFVAAESSDGWTTIIETTTTQAVLAAAANDAAVASRDAAAVSAANALTSVQIAVAAQLDITANWSDKLATAAEQAGIATTGGDVATTQAGISTTQAGLAATAKTAAEAARDAAAEQVAAVMEAAEQVAAVMEAAEQAAEVMEAAEQALAALANLPKTTSYVQPQSTGAVAGGVVDATIGLQAAFDSGKVVVIDDVFLTSGNQIPSGSHIVFVGNGQLKLANGANRPVLQNVNWNKAGWGGSTYGLDSDITIEGLNIDGNDANQLHHRADTGEWVSGVKFWGVTNLKITRATITRAKTFGIWVAAIDRLTVDDVTFKQTMTGTPSNQDGLHVNGPARFIDIRNIKGSTNDDMVALNADDALPPYSGYPTGAITDVVIDGLYGDGCLNGIRLLSATSRISRVSISNVLGSYRDPAINLSAYGLGAGNFGSVSIDGVNVTCSNPYSGAGSDYYGVIVLDDKIESVSIKNIHRHNAADTRPLVDVRPGSVIHSLTIDQISLYTGAGGVAQETVLNVQGTVKVLGMRGLDWYKDATVARGGRVIHVNGGAIGQLNASGWATRRLGNLIEVTVGTLDPIRLMDVLDIDSDPVGAVVLLANSAETGVYLENIRTNPGRPSVRTTGGASVWSGSSINPAGPSGAGAHLTSDQAIGATYSVMAFNVKDYDRANEFSTSTYKFTNTIGIGLYDITVMAGVTVPTANTLLVMAMYRNGVAERYVYGNTHSSDCNITSTVRVLLQLGDVIDMRFYSSNTTTLQGGSARTTINIERMK